MKFLREKRKIAERQHGLTVSQETRGIETREKIEKGVADDLFCLDPAVSCHPMIPVPYFEFRIQDDETEIDRLENLGKFIHTAP